MLTISEAGLKQRGFGEESYLVPLKERVKEGRSPAMKAIDVFKKQGMQGLLEQVLIRL